MSTGAMGVGESCATLDEGLRLTGSQMTAAEIDEKIVAPGTD